MVHIDFITDLLEDEGFSAAMIVVDRFSKMCSFVPLSSTTAASVATTFFKNLWHTMDFPGRSLATGIHNSPVSFGVV